MAIPRHLLLYPRFFRASLSSAFPAAEATPQSPRSMRSRKEAAFSTSAQRRTTPELATQRYGTANEPPAHLGSGASVPSPTQPKESEQKKLPEPEQREQQPASQDSQQQRYRTSLSEPPLEERQARHRSDELDPTTDESFPNAAPPNDNTPIESSPSDPPPASPADARLANTSALSNILHMEPPMSTPSDTAPPHLQTPPHVHHFDTHTLVHSLTSSGAFTEIQATTIMKALRLLLAENIALARRGLVSRSDAEMDAYQFRAAASELRTEIRQRRNGTSERMRADRTQLQHEVDILTQRLGQESLNLKDELKGLFDDRKMGVRTERRALDNRIQELGYKITVAMNSGMRTEIEALRFTVTRNAALTLGAFILGTLSVLWMAARRKMRDKKEETERKDGDKVERRLREAAPSGGKGNEAVGSEEKGAETGLVSLG